MIENPIKRRPTRKIRVGSVYVGGDAPISVQSMTNTETCDVDATVAQIERCVDAGADIMRVSVDRKSTRLNSSHMSESRMPSSA